MKIQRLTAVLTIVNFIILILVLVWIVRPGLSPGVAPVLRGHALEIVDDQGKVRAQIVVAPASMAQDGKAYPETVLFRLIDPNGRPTVKLGASVQGSGLLLSGEYATEWNGIQILAQDPGNTLRLLDKDGREQIIKP